MLLLLAITRGVYKIDQKYIPPNTKVMTALVKEAMAYAKVDTASLRKPELVEFVLGNSDILSFLETWRGHASQVLLGGNNKWRDLSFPANALSIAPSRDWLYEGLPPSSFVKWRRKDKVGSSGLGCGSLFTHEVSFLKTVDRRVVYKGEGVIGAGSLKQGLLADRWYLNALAALIAKPDLITACFAMTGQEDAGRHCVRLYEGSGFRSVYVDDRLPCSPDTNPLFCSSSSALEYWPLILEKGLAKYLGSFGQLARCSKRSDATLTSLRMLTGGHVLRYYTKYYEWCSVEDEVTDGENASVFIRDLLAEGSLVSFGRSETLSMMNRKSAATKGSTNNFYVVPPHGRLFPVLGSVYIKGFQYFILRDAWNLIADADSGVNFDTGHSNTFQIKIEDVPFLYDTMIVTRFPDSLRSSAVKRNLKPWSTTVVQNTTNGISDPARFVLTVPPKPVERKTTTDAKQQNPTRRTSSVQEVLQEMDAVREEDAGFDPKSVRLRDKIDFSRRKSSMSKAKESEKAELLRQTEQKESVVDKLHSLQNALVDVSFTISSSCDWTFSGSKEAGAQLRVKLTPSAHTFKDILERERQLIEIRQRAEEILAKKREAQAKMLEIQANTVVNDDGSVSVVESKEESSVASGSLPQGGANAVDPAVPGNADSSSKQPRGSQRKPMIVNNTAAAASKITPTTTYSNAKAPPKPEVMLFLPKRDKGGADSEDAEEAYRKKLERYTRQFDLTLTAERSWLSHSVKLLPGEYSLFVDVTYAVPYTHAFKMTIPNDIREAPWLQAATIVRDAGTKQSISTTLKSSHNLKSGVNSISNSSGPSPLHSPNKHGNSGNFSAMNSKLNLNASQHTLSVATQETTEQNVPAQMPAVDPTLFDSHKIHVQLTNQNNAEITPVEKAYFAETFDCSLGYLEVGEEKWPFMTETQSEVSSRELVRLLTQVKAEAETTGLEFMALTSRYKESRRLDIARQTQLKRETLK